MKQKQGACGIERSKDMNQTVAIEILHDMYFITKLFEIQSRMDDKWLRDYYTKIAVPYLSIVLHECLQAGVLDKKESDKDVIKLLKSIRKRIVKLVPIGSSHSMKHFMDTMGIDFEHYCFDLQIALNESNHGELYDIGFTYYDLLEGTEDMKSFDSLIKIPLQIVESILTSEPLCKHRTETITMFQSIYSGIANIVSAEVSLHKYPYASSVFFKHSKLDKDDKVAVLYYYTLVKQSLLMDVLIPESVEEAMDIFDTLRAKCKYRAVIIENIGRFLKCARTSLTEEMCNKINAAMDSDFFARNRSIRNNIHYKMITEFSKADIKKMYMQQELYLKTVLDIFEDKIEYNVGVGYKLIRFIADKTDATMIEVRRMNPERKKLEDVSIEEWEGARTRLSIKNRKQF